MDIPGITIGHATDLAGATGITVVLCEAGAVCGLDVRGGGSSLRNPTVALPGHRVEQVHAVFFAGGSAYGLDAGGGVMRHLERRGIGFPVRGLKVPIVTGAILFDLGVGNARRRPDEAMAARACRAARAAHVAEGSIGAGTGASIGKYFGIPRAMKGGLGVSTVVRGRLKVGALAVVNAFGDVRDPQTGEILAGARNSVKGRRLVGTEAHLRGDESRSDRERNLLGLQGSGRRDAVGGTWRVMLSRAGSGGLGIAQTRQRRSRLLGFGAQLHAHTGAEAQKEMRAAAGARRSLRDGSLQRYHPAAKPSAGESTTLGLVATNARLTREQACRLACASHVALARCLSPAHTTNDGDLVYTLSTGRIRADPRSWRRWRWRRSPAPSYEVSSSRRASVGFQPGVT